MSTTNNATPPAVVATRAGIMERITEELRRRRLNKRELRFECAHALYKVEVRQDAYERLTAYNARLEADRRFAEAVVDRLGRLDVDAAGALEELERDLRQLNTERVLEHQLHVDPAEL